MQIVNVLFILTAYEILGCQQEKGELFVEEEK